MTTRKVGLPDTLGQRPFDDSTGHFIMYFLFTCIYASFWLWHNSVIDSKEAYEEFKHVLLAFIYDKDDQTSPVVNEVRILYQLL